MTDHPHNGFPYVLASPGYLAGGGTWEHLTELLLRGHGWRDISTIDYHTALASQDGQLQLVLDGARARRAWTLRGITPAAQQWTAILDEHIPVEHVTAAVEALLHPAPGPSVPKRPGVLDQLHAAGWAMDRTAHDPAALSPDGLVRFIHERGKGREGGPWHTACTIGQRRLWAATFSAHTPPPAIGAFAARLAAGDPLPRMAIGTPLYGCERHTHLTPCPLSPQGEREQLEARVADAQARRHRATGTLRAGQPSGTPGRAPTAHTR